MSSWSDHLADLRQRVAAARIRLRHLEHEHRIAKATAEQRIIEEAGGAKALGANTEDRERAMVIALSCDAAYRMLTDELMDARDDVDSLEADLESALDERRERERETRDRFADALLLSARSVDRLLDDEALDVAADRIAASGVLTDPVGAYEAAKRAVAVAEVEEIIEEGVQEILIDGNQF